jgi:serine/threonine kinase 32/serum/glucocorticoid-regulated kinase 2
VLLPVGKGGFGKVWKVMEKRTKRTYAMKMMSKIKIINKKSVSSVMNERNYLAQLNHPFLVNMVYAFQDRENLFLVMDYLDGGDLRYHMGNRQFFN